jgi:hypothetical protein
MTTNFILRKPKANTATPPGQSLKNMSIEVDNK